jgi:hypothetical protein
MNVAARKQQAMEDAGRWDHRLAAMQVEGVWTAIPRCHTNKAVDSLSDEWGDA